MDEYMIGILALGFTAVALFLGVKLYDRWRDRRRDRKSDHVKQELFHRDR